jgi:hypothetical protein
MEAKGAFWNYVRVFRAHWLAAMSGGFSVPFTALAVVAGDKYQQAIFGALAFAAFWFAAFRVWKVEHDKVLQFEQTVDPVKTREIEATENHAEELRRHTAELEAQRQSKRMDRFREQFLAPPRPLNIVVGTGGSFERLKATSVRDRERTFYLKVENRDQHKPLRNCKLDITSVTPIPDPDRGMPWTLEQDFSLAAGEHKLVKLARYEEHIDPHLEERWRNKFMVVFSNDPKNWLLLEIKEQILEIRATSPDSGYCDVKCKLWVDENWKFHIERI